MDVNRTPEPGGLHTVLVLGDTNRAEMRSLSQWLHDRIGSAGHFVAASDTSQLEQVISTDIFPELIVVFQSWPDQFPARDVSNLFALAPLARIVVCHGAWCESDGRNRQVWPQSVCVPVWAATARIDREWRLIQSPGDDLPIPSSASRDEVFAADHPAIKAGHDMPTAYIDTPDASYRQFLIEYLTEAGFRVTDDNPAILVFDADPWGAQRIEALTELRNTYSDADFVAAASLIQPPLEEELRRFGINAVFPKLGGQIPRPP